MIIFYLNMNVPAAYPNPYQSPYPAADPNAELRAAQEANPYAVKIARQSAEIRAARDANRQKREKYRILKDTFMSICFIVFAVTILVATVIGLLAEKQKDKILASTDANYISGALGEVIRKEFNTLGWTMGAFGVLFLTFLGLERWVDYKYEVCTNLEISRKIQIKPK